MVVFQEEHVRYRPVICANGQWNGSAMGPIAFGEPSRMVWPLIQRGDAQARGRVWYSVRKRILHLAGSAQCRVVFCNNWHAYRSSRGSWHVEWGAAPYHHPPLRTVG